MRTFIRRFGTFTAAAAMLLAGCATQRPPEGGPIDSEPPFVVEIIPSNGTVRYTGQQVSFEFNEYVQRATFQESVHISPLPDVPPKYEWSGRRVRVVFDSPLLENRTYVITVGTKVRDLRAGNTMLETLHLAFSTGDSLDQGAFSGTVTGDSPGGVSVFAYLLDGVRADTLDPAKERPDYAVQTAEGGAFRFSNVAPGSYRVFAVRDKSNDFRYNAESEDIGVPDRDILVIDSLSVPQPIRLHLHMEDTTRPNVQRIEALNDRVIRVKFNETVYPQPLPLERVAVSDSASGRRIPLFSAVDAPSDRYAWDFRTSEALDTRTYLLVIDSLVDGAGNMIDAIPFPLSFIGSDAADTARPVILRQTTGANARNIDPDSSFRVVFDRPLRVDDVFMLRDSADNAIELRAQRISDAEIALVHPPLLPEATYTLCIDETVILDTLSGRSIGDSIRCHSFTTGKRTLHGTIAGEVRSDDSVGVAVVRVREAVRDPRVRSQRTDSTRTFRFDDLPEGKYLLDAFIDRNGNHRYDAGKPYPFTRPEPYGAVRDTLRVRARWETGGIIIPLQSSSPADSTAR